MTTLAPSYFQSAEFESLEGRIYGPQHEGAAESLETLKLMQCYIIPVYDACFLGRRI